MTDVATGFRHSTGLLMRVTTCHALVLDKPWLFKKLHRESLKTSVFGKKMDLYAIDFNGEKSLKKLCTFLHFAKKSFNTNWSWQKRKKVLPLLWVDRNSCNSPIATHYFLCVALVENIHYIDTLVPIPLLRKIHIFVDIVDINVVGSHSCYLVLPLVYWLTSSTFSPHRRMEI